MAQRFLYRVIFFDLGDTLVTDNSDAAASDRKVWISGAVETLEQLAADGVNLGIISNTGELTRSELAELLPLDFNFDRFHPDLVILSSEVFLTNQIAPKPSLEIFRFARARAQTVLNGKCLYCSENLKETYSAQRAGMNSLRLLPPSGSTASEITELVSILQR